MKKACLLVTFILLLSGCGKDGKVVDFELLQKRNGVSFMPNETAPFTGRGQVHFVNGQLEAEVTYKDGQMNGLSRSWHENGQLKIEGSFKDGEENGLSRMWDENGQLKNEATFKDGQMNGLSLSLIHI